MTASPLPTDSDLPEPRRLADPASSRQHDRMRSSTNSRSAAPGASYPPLPAIRRRPNSARNPALPQQNPEAGRGAEAEWATIVLEALRGIDELDSAAVRLVYWHGLTQTEAANRLGIPAVDVGARVARGMRNLGDRLSRDSTESPSAVNEPDLDLSTPPRAHLEIVETPTADFPESAG